MNPQTFETSFERKIETTLEEAFDAWANSIQWCSWIELTRTGGDRRRIRDDTQKDDKGEYHFGWETVRFQRGSKVEVCLVQLDEHRVLCKLVQKNMQTESDIRDSNDQWNPVLDYLKSLLESNRKSEK